MKGRPTMERATKVILVEDTPPVPRRKSSKKSETNILRDQKEALRLSPDSLVVDNAYPKDTYEESLKAAKAAAYVVNSGERKAWPKEEYYAIWRTMPDQPRTDNEEDGDDKPKVVQLLIGLRSHIKPEWEAVVNRAGSRVGKVDVEDDTEDDDPFSDDED